jgi:hypothetical protein
MLLALALLLLLFQQLVEADFLLGIQNGAKLFAGLLQFFTDFRLNRFHDLFRTLLAGGQYFIDLLALLGCQVQVAFCSAQKFDSNAAGGDGLNTITLSSTLTRLVNGRLGCVLDDQGARYDASAENDDGRKDDLPGVHQMESDACWLAAARTVFSKSCEKSPCAGVGEAKKAQAPMRTTIATHGTVARQSAPAQRAQPSGAATPRNRAITRV